MENDDARDDAGLPAFAVDSIISSLDYRSAARAAATAKAWRDAFARPAVRASAARQTLADRSEAARGWWLAPISCKVHVLYSYHNGEKTGSSRYHKESSCEDKAACFAKGAEVQMCYEDYSCFRPDRHDGSATGIVRDPDPHKVERDRFFRSALPIVQLLARSRPLPRVHKKWDVPMPRDLPQEQMDALQITRDDWRCGQNAPSEPAHFKEFFQGQSAWWVAHEMHACEINLGEDKTPLRLLLHSWNQPGFERRPEGMGRRRLVMVDGQQMAQMVTIAEFTDSR